ncbi:MAG: hypothetical protein E5X53_17270 [Mesorhizobium sp.]|uniref:hypothetical protein n=1 Tax=Mesorhizobium sp. TaxID=1871066 RepID=UPI00120B3CF8|nr:hypothetical protein [Mesorhizobium sp.]TIP73331.1 MAG: hypothetical protein E5X55_14520 [Mesorhizobium sp.]TIQ11334.1 MAG: hypothetical protein E5X57_18315 [Mesorhizobium sp.]TIR50915.1 MAG: hypothetical protein E5X53_17270 [Mesorhizobium sp.]TJV97365.1 MAG: hypothetical protein E5X52_14910 [Mesorhizobium sp.]
MNLDANVLPVVDERMIDILLLEMLHIDSRFRSWFCALIDPQSGTSVSLVSARHSVFETSTGETDVEIVCAENAIKVGYLVENKIHAPFMPRQLERYRMRGDEGRVSGKWGSFRVVLLAPQKYLAGLCEEERQFLDIEVPYEAVLDWFEKAGRPDLAFKRHILTTAIASARKGYVKQADRAMTEFWRSYWLHLKSPGSIVEMAEPPEKGRDSSWIDFLIPRKAPKCRLYHKFRKGTVELVIACRDAERAEALFAPMLDEDMEFAAGKATAAVCIRVPPIDHHIAFALLSARVNSAVAQLGRLQNLSVSPEFRAALSDLDRSQ